MADKSRLKDNGNQVDFSSLAGYDPAEDRRRNINVALTGPLYMHEWGNKGAHTIPVNNIGSADALRIITWWQNMTSLTFTPDLDSPATTFSVKIINETVPMLMMFPNWDSKYYGTLQLRQV